MLISPRTSVARIVAALLCWFGCVSSFARVQAAPALKTVRIEPSNIKLEGAADHRQLVVTAVYVDGSVRDITREAKYFSIDACFHTTGFGVISAVADKVGSIYVMFGDKRFEVPVESRRASEWTPPGYRRDVVALLSKAGCNMGTCHGNINGKGGLRLSLRGDDPSADFLALTRDSFGRRINLTNAGASLLIAKPTGKIEHEGGVRFGVHSPEAAILLNWIMYGAKDDEATTPRLTRLRVYPERQLNAAPGLTQQLSVTAEFSDHTVRDVTTLASFDVDDPIKVSVSAGGLVSRKSAGETTVSVRYLNGRAISRLAFLHDRAGFVARSVPNDNSIDAAVFAKLNALKVTPSEPATDAVFLRRAHLDSIGVLPTPEETRAFLSDDDPHKRAKLIDRLVVRPEFADFWALKWADLLRNEEKTMGDKGAWIFQRWLRDQMSADVPLDEFARQIVSAQGSTHRNPPASFYRTNQDPQTAAESVGQVFLGVRVQCARCHNHPYDVWTQDDYYGMSAHFANLSRKILDETKRDRFDKHEINGDVIIHLKGRPGMVQPRSGAMMDPKPLGAKSSWKRDDPNALDDLARWLTRDNPQFARNMANRIWFHLVGRGVVEPVDDFRDSNPPSNPELLDALTSEFVRNGMRLKPLVAFIMKSRTYALGSDTNDSNADDESNFSHAQIKLHPAEVLLDAVSLGLERPESFSNAPRFARATQLSGIQSGSSFLKTFGKPDRLLTCECERSDATTLAQAFEMLNGPSIRSKIQADDNRIGRLIARGASDDAILDELVTALLSRSPTASERADLLAHVRKSSDRRRGWEDVAWVLLNTKEFLLRH